MFRLSLLPASDGDCLILSWGDPGEVRHLVVDGGRAGAYRHLRPRLAQMAEAGEPLELFVLSHIDADHIAGAIAMAEDERLPVEPVRVWYNGFDQLSRLQPLGERQGDRYSDALAARGWPLNEGFDQEVVSIETVPAGLEVGGLAITILSPDWRHLAELRARWEDWREDQAAEAARLALEDAERGTDLVPLGRSPMPDVLVVGELAAPGPIDREPPNGSSIAFVAEWRGMRMLLAGDAHPDLLEESLRPLAEREGGRYRVDLFKVSHHGSRKNTTPDLVRLLDCRRFAFSSNGNLHGHPDPEAVARLLLHAPEGRKCLYFNYDTDRSGPWNDAALAGEYDYEWIGPGGVPGLVEIDLDPAR